jgi:cytochrome c peroxidase
VVVRARPRPAFFGAGVLVVAGVVFAARAWRPSAPWTAEETAALLGLWIGSLAPVPLDRSNRHADDPAAAAFGHELFFDPRFSANGQISCATCHRPELGFQDGRRLGRGLGTASRRTMPVVGTAYAPWFFWDGRKDSQWAQALGPLENPVEQGANRTRLAFLVARHHRERYEGIFGPLPSLSALPEDAGPLGDAAARAAWQAKTAREREDITRVFTNLGKAIAAYERLLVPGPSRFDRYVEAYLAGDLGLARKILTADEIAGLRLFIGRASCVRCHNGPLFTNNDFHNTGVPGAADLPEDLGRAAGVAQVVADEFNCAGRYSDAEATACTELRVVVAAGRDLRGQFKPPSLRNVAARAPYMHAGQVASLGDVLRHYDAAPTSRSGRSELKPLGLTGRERDQIVAFLGTLTGPVAADGRWLAPPPVVAPP